MNTEPRSASRPVSSLSVPLTAAADGPAGAGMSAESGGSGGTGGKKGGRRTTSEASLRSVILAVASAQFLLPFMMSGVGPLLPAIGRDLSASAMQLSLINAVYSLSLAIVYLVSGRVGDILGRKRIFLAGLIIFTCMSGLIPFAPNIELFLVLRFSQAVGTAMMNTSALAILASCAPASMLGRVLGIASIGMYAGLSLGPGLSGVIATMSSWRYLFWGVVPIGVLAWCLMAFTVKGDWKDAPEARFDWKGAVCYTIGICALSTGGIWILEGMWALGLVVAGIAFLALFARVETRYHHPILDVRFLLHNKPFALSTLAALINYSSTFGVMFYFSLFLQGVHGLGILETGFMLTIQTAVQIFIAPYAGRLADKHGAGNIATIGMALSGLGLIVSAFLDGGSTLWQVGAAQLILGIGIALFASPNTAAVMSAVDQAHLGQASGLVGTMRTLGMLFSMVIISLTMNSFLGDAPLGPGNSGAFLEAMHTNLVLFGVLNLIGISFSFARIRATRAGSKG